MDTVGEARRHNVSTIYISSTTRTRTNQEEPKYGSSIEQSETKVQPSATMDRIAKKNYLDLSVDGREIGGLTTNGTTVLLLDALLATENHSLGAFFLRHGNLKKSRPKLLA